MTDIEKEQAAILSNILNEQYPSTDSSFFCYSLFMYYILGAVMAIINHYTALSNFYSYIYLFCGFVYFVTNIFDLIRCDKYKLREYMVEDGQKYLAWISNIVYTITTTIVLILMPCGVLSSTIAAGMFVLALFNVYRLFMTINVVELVDEGGGFFCVIGVPTKFLKPCGIVEGFYKNGEFTPYTGIH